MHENTTIARPYAKAIFILADNNNLLDKIDEFLHFFCNFILNKNVNVFLFNKTIGHDEKSNFIINILKDYKVFKGKLQIVCENFVKLLSYYDRLNCIKEIYFLYKKYKNEKLGYVEAFVEVAYPISDDKKDYIIDCLSKKFNKKVSAEFVENNNLIGGFLVRIEDFVLDASILGNLSSLSSRIFV